MTPDTLLLHRRIHNQSSTQYGFVLGTMLSCLHSCPSHDCGLSSDQIDVTFSRRISNVLFKAAMLKSPLKTTAWWFYTRNSLPNLREGFRSDSMPPEKAQLQFHASPPSLTICTPLEEGLCSIFVWFVLIVVFFPTRESETIHFKISWDSFLE